MFEGRETLWVVHIGKDDEVPLRAREEGFMCIGWSAMGDLSRYTTREAMKEAMRNTWPGWSDKKVSSSFGQVFRFAHEMQVGDPVIFPIKQTREVAIGRVKGDYVFSTDEQLVELDYANYRDVEWLRIVPRTAFSQAALHSFGSFSSVSTSDDHLEEVVSVLQNEPTTVVEEEPRAVKSDDAESQDEEGFDLYTSALQETEDYLLRAWHRTGAMFERVVAAVLEAMGYTATVTKASGDHGVDVVAHPDALGLQPPFIKVQVKSGTSTTGEPDVSQLLGSIADGEKGIFVSLGGFSSGALSKARNNSTRITLLDSEKFVKLFLDHYDRLDPSWRARFPLHQVYVPKKT